MVKLRSLSEERMVFFGCAVLSDGVGWSAGKVKTKTNTAILPLRLRSGSG